MPQVVITWRGPEAAKIGIAEFRRRLGVAAQMLKDDIRRSLRTPYPPASEPGQPPAKRSGLLEDDIDVWEEQLDSLLIGVREESKAYYAAFLEIGTSIMAARPFLRPALLRNLERFRRIVGAPIGAHIRSRLGQ